MSLSEEMFYLLNNISKQAHLSDHLSDQSLDKTELLRACKKIIPLTKFKSEFESPQEFADWYEYFNHKSYIIRGVASRILENVLVIDDQTVEYAANLSDLINRAFVFKIKYANPDLTFRANDIWELNQIITDLQRTYRKKSIHTTREYMKKYRAKNSSKKSKRAED